ncbi:MAG: hypothetical protein G01um101466_188 [Parcubacteria group bacterium Gr01-1014_66]|nr:MAG: hypothetical protein G01um101466_188 [Parcubacteria group bacterium Gr01-1014_66]
MRICEKDLHKKAHISGLFYVDLNLTCDVVLPIMDKNMISIWHKKIVLISVLIACIGVGIITSVYLIRKRTVTRGEETSLLSKELRNDSFAKGTVNNEIEDEAPRNQQETEKETPSFVPVYRGRNASEVRPDAKVVSSLPLKEREKIYTDIRIYGAELKADPALFSTWLQVGLLKKVIGDYEGARDAWEYATVIYPQSSVAFSNLGELYWRYLPNFPLAEARFMRAIAINSADPRAYISLAEFYSFGYKEKQNQAPLVLQQGIEANPEDIRLMTTLAETYEKRGEKKLALEWWERAHLKMPGNQEITRRIEELKKQLNSS